MSREEIADKYGHPTQADQWISSMKWDHYEVPGPLNSRYFHPEFKAPPKKGRGQAVSK